MRVFRDRVAFYQAIYQDRWEPRRRRKNTIFRKNFLTIPDKADSLAISSEEDKFLSDKLYTQGEVSKIFPDVPNKTLIYWARQELVEWAAETRDARGIARLYNRWNLFQLGLVRELAGLGILIEGIRRIMSFFKDFPPEGHYSYDNEGNKVLETCLPSEFFSSENGLKDKLIIIKKMDDRGWQEPTIAGTSNLTDDNDLFKKEFGLLMNIHTTVIINLSTIHDYVDHYIKKADLS